MDEWTRAIAEALGCERVNERDSWAGRPYCAEHGYLWLSDTDTCPTTERIAAALAPLIEARVREARAQGSADAYADVMRQAADQSMACRRVAEEEQ